MGPSIADEGLLIPFLVGLDSLPRVGVVHIGLAGGAPGHEQHMVCSGPLHAHGRASSRRIDELGRFVVADVAAVDVPGDQGKSSVLPAAGRDAFGALFVVQAVRPLRFSSARDCAPTGPLRGGVRGPGGAAKGAEPCGGAAACVACSEMLMGMAVLSTSQLFRAEQAVVRELRALGPCSVGPGRRAGHSPSFCPDTAPRRPHQRPRAGRKTPHVRRQILARPERAGNPPVKRDGRLQPWNPHTPEPRQRNRHTQNRHRPKPRRG